MYLRSKEAKRVEDIIYDADTIKNQGQDKSTREMGDYRPSSMIDYLEGRGVEVEAIWAEPLRRAQVAGARLPRWEGLLEAIRRRLAERG